MSVSSGSARDLLVGMVSTPSPSGEERTAAERLVDFFEAHDREAWLDEVGNVRAPADDRVLLTSHIDTVPGEIPVRTEDGTLWGRGSVDATGPLCAMACAAVVSHTSFVGVVGEETDSRGAWHLIEDRESPDALINGEPSGWDGVTLGYRGMLAGTYVATSESGHTSRPEPNAIQHAIGWWSRVEERFAPDEDEEWGPVFERVTTKPVEIEGGTDADGLSVSATLDGQFRVPPSMTTEEVREIAEGQLRTDTDAAGTVNWGKPIPPVMESPRTELARAFRVAIRGEDGDPRLLRKTGTSDMNIYASAWDCPMVTYGPGDSDLDHAPDERLDLAEYDRSIAVLTEVADRL
ncbi:acetyl-lysine deacetylase [Halalkalicoccus paucihalophilus]|uniref:Putative [LysW]-lysine/[LysW]-ornithine hydrolase n=1 Tax=Halalkalicoccus paucihalophilus TaxID=1008153 RepID=A0A151AH19_9EURY|nr:[LysW]-lysine hydrolase [Halalkalicoccus paucihalophilus]KYH26966.1 acetyl-lysine deacetylase [Halalkalicoccus paucihalophilus]